MNFNRSLYTFVQYTTFSFLIICELGACNFGGEETKVVTDHKTIIDKKTKEPDLSEFKKVEPNAASDTVNSIESKSIIRNVPEEKQSSSLANEGSPAPIAKKIKENKRPKNNTTDKKPIIKQAKILFEEAVHDFGEITEGDIIKHKFKFKNTGNAELVIKSAYASCGCTDPSYPFMGIPPGEEGFIGLVYNSVGKDGPQKPEVTIKTNADDLSIVLFLKGIVNPKKKEKTSEKPDSINIEKN